MQSRLESVDWTREGAAAVGLLRDLIRFDTTNPPGGEGECIAFLADHLRMAGMDPEVLDPGGAGRTSSFGCAAAGTGRRGRCCCTGTWMWSRRRLRGGSIRPSPARCTTGRCGAGAPSI